MAFVLKNIVYSLFAATAFYIVLLGGDTLGFRQISEKSFSVVSILITLITFNFSVANIRIK
ncbi:MAG: hypothetical protein HY544_03230 [Candidatus Diapherotrites archaeon]|uniref:Uncharacterized protein n=1 Tax=Candidatus Iainarchaeum sp. TaxID=3101447 RepID=A0A8T3YLC8_9ARCH|nr:hypothetical protein [Candidatus Diapherotrites archaeon]